MKHLCLCLVIVVGVFSNAFGQLLTVGNQKVCKEEFVRLYEKNTSNPNYSERSLREHLDRLIIYKLKVQEALDQNLENLPHIQRELKNYAAQLAQPYLTDRDLLEKMLYEAYEYSHHDIRARQIMIRCSPLAKPQDTLVAYQTAMRIRERLIRGEDFDKVATEESEKSEMIIVGSRQEKRIGSSDLGYFNVFATPYNIEKYVFTSEIGEHSMPLRTGYGYHIIQVMDRQPTLGRINASRIFLRVPEGADESEIKRKADSLYYLIINGAKTFGEVARQFSDDDASKLRGGRLAEFNATYADPLFIANLYKMPIEVVSRPFRAKDGYHIVIIHNAGNVGSYKEQRPTLLYHLQHDSRADLIKQSFINSLSNTYPVVEFKSALQNFARRLNPVEFDGFWTYEPDHSADSVLGKVGNRMFTYKDFGKFVELNQTDYRHGEESLMAFLEQNYQRYIGEMLILCETENVGQKYEEFNREFSEYRDGILLYEIKDREVWRKSSEDTAGIHNFYNSQRHRYMWPARIQALIFKYDVRHINTDNVHKFLVASYRRRLIAEQIIEQANKNFDPKHISVTVNVYEPGQNKFADRVDWTQSGLSKDIATGGFEKGFVYIYNYFPPSPKSLEDVKGIIVEEYQTFLEREWIKKMQSKYEVRVDEVEFKQLIKR
jgi:peptidyl-prolyl cis-trans isomerase SurA